MTDTSDSRVFNMRPACALTAARTTPRIKPMRLFGTSGIRRLADASLLDISLKVGLALGQRYGRIIVGSDTRTSSPALKSILIAGLTAAGAETWDAGVLPTPTLAIAARDYDCAVMITASHNPPPYNGLKLLNPDGSPFNSEQQQIIEDNLSRDVLGVTSWDRFNTLYYNSTAVDQHIRHIKGHFLGEYPVRVVVDCGGGCATAIAPLLLNEMGCEVHVLNGTPTGFFPRPSEPAEENLYDLKDAVKKLGAALGLAHDGDADRLMAVDDAGRFISGDTLLWILAREIGAHSIVTTVDASMALDETAIAVTRTAVGDNNVSESLRIAGDFGGEPSGAWVFPGSSLCPDGIFAAAMLVSIANQKKLSSLADDIRKYPMRRGSIGGKIALEWLEPELVAALHPQSVQRLDGIKLMLNDGWALVRQSGTEPMIRLTVEATTEPRLQSIYEQIENLIMESIRK